MARLLPRRDVVVVGLGWSGSIIANELTEEGLDVVALERGPWRDTAADFNIGVAPDELRFARRRELMVSPAQVTVTTRNNASQTALPMREWGSFHPGNGVGGAGIHWAGITYRFHPTDFRLRSHLTERYGAAAIPEELSVQDWGTDWEEMEPFYDRFDYLAGISGKAGNIQGRIEEGGNPFEGPRARDYPLPPMRQPYGPTLFAEAARGLGYHVFPAPSALLSQGYVNTLGIAMGPCTYCGFCTNYGCANYSKASAQTAVLPVLMRKPNFELRTLCEVLRLRLDPSRRQVRSVIYLDSDGEEWEQPADLVVVTAFTLDNVRLMLLSGVGETYDPRTRRGTIGRNFSYQMGNGAQCYFENKVFNTFIGGGAIGMAIDDLNNDNFDHGGLGFFGGGSVRCIPVGATPIAQRPVPPGTPRWGSAWKRATVKYYQANLNVSAESSSYSSPANHLDLDPTYTDRLGRPLLRITFDFPENDRRMSRYVTARAAEIGRAMGASQVVETVRDGHWSSVPYQSTHVVGGMIMGADPTTSAVNKYLQSWDVPNLFVVGASAFPQNSGYNPTGTVGALAFKAADAIRTRYLAAPGPLVPA